MWKWLCSVTVCWPINAFVSSSQRRQNAKRDVTIYGDSYLYSNKRRKQLICSSENSSHNEFYFSHICSYRLHFFFSCNYLRLWKASSNYVHTFFCCCCSFLSLCVCLIRYFHRHRHCRRCRFYNCNKCIHAEHRQFIDTHKAKAKKKIENGTKTV